MTALLQKPSTDAVIWKTNFNGKTIMNNSKSLAAWEQSGCVCVCVLVCLQGGHYWKAGLVKVCVNTLSAIRLEDWLITGTEGVVYVRPSDCCHS